MNRSTGALKVISSTDELRNIHIFLLFQCGKFCRWLITLLLVVNALYHCFFPLSVQLRRYEKTNEEKGDDQKKWQKTKISLLSFLLVKKPWQRPAVLRFLLTSKNGLSYMGKGKALLFYETQLTSSALKVFLVVVNLKVSRYQHKSCVYLFGKSDPQIQRYKDTDNLS